MAKEQIEEVWLTSVPRSWSQQELWRRLGQTLVPHLPTFCWLPFQVDFKRHLPCVFEFTILLLLLNSWIIDEPTNPQRLHIEWNLWRVIRRSLSRKWKRNHVSIIIIIIIIATTTFHLSSLHRAHEISGKQLQMKVRSSSPSSSSFL